MSYTNDDEMLADLRDGVLEREADRLCAALLAAEQAVAAEDPDLLVALDANAAAYGEARQTWHADLLCGDLPIDYAEERAIELEKNARHHMYRTILTAGNPPWPGAGRRREYDALAGAALALHNLLAPLHGDTRGMLQEYIAEMLGDRGPRYILGL